MSFSVTVRQLEVFDAAARRLSFSRAADDLYTSQPAVSRQIKELERSLDVELFHRAGRRVALTDAGLVLQDYARRAFELAREAARALEELKGLERGYLRLAASSTTGLYVLPDLMAAFHRQYPGVRLSLHVASDEDVVRRVLAGEADLGFTGVPEPPADVHWQPFVEDRLALIAPAGHAFAGRREVAPVELAAETILVREEGSGTRMTADREMERLGIRGRQTIEVTGVGATKEAVRAGLGVAFVSRRAVARELASGLLVAVTVAGMNPVRPLSMVSARSVRLSVAALAFSAHAQQSHA